jgi:hypothetical protein
MVTIHLNIVYDLTPQERKAAYVSKTELERERDLVQNCIIPAVEQYLSDINIKEMAYFPTHKKPKKGFKVNYNGDVEM